MSKQNHSKENSGQDMRNAERDDSVARLMTLAGLRPVIPAELEARVYADTRKIWRRTLPAYRRKKWIRPLAIAASLLMVATFSLRFGHLKAPRLGTIARVSTDLGTVVRGIRVGRRVRVGDILQTGDDHMLNIAMANGTSLRLATNTTLRMDSKRSFTLLAGEIYADSGDSQKPDKGIEVRTKLGVITDVGTQFMVSYANTALSVAVREGRIDVNGGQDTYSALAGQRLIMQASGDVINDRIGAMDSAWDWTLKVASAFDMENKNLLQFLEWVSRETGKKLVFASDAVRQAATETILHGSISDLTPTEAAASVLASNAFDYTPQEMSIFVTR